MVGAAQVSFINDAEHPPSYIIYLKIEINKTYYYIVVYGDQKSK